MPRKLKTLSAREILSLVACRDWMDIDKIKEAMKEQSYLDAFEIAKSAHVRRADRLWILLMIMRQERFRFPKEIKEEFATWYVENASQITANVCMFHLPPDAYFDLLQTPTFVYQEDSSFLNDGDKLKYDRKLLRKITYLMEKWLKGNV